MIRDISHLPSTKVVCKRGVTLRTLAETLFADHRYCVTQSHMTLVFAGTNDMESRSIEEVLEDIRAIVTQYRSLKVGHIGFATIIPRPKDGRKMADKVKAYNFKLMAWCADNGCVCVRAHGPFLLGGRPRQGLFNRGRLHLRSGGSFPSGAYILRNFLRSELADKTLYLRMSEVERRFFDS